MNPYHFPRIVLLSLTLAGVCRAGDVPAVQTMRVPGGGVQPQACVDEKGTVHLIYLSGDPSHSDVFYVRSADAGQTFSKPLRVNSQPGSAMAIGTVRGAYMAVGKEGRVYVAWNGSSTAEPKAPGKNVPMLYSQSTDDGSFTPQRNLIQSHPGLNGGGSIAADTRGNVFVTWSAPIEGGEGEQARRIWLTRSADGGKTFSAEESISPETGVCGCCGMRLFAAGGSLYALYRGADQKTERDTTLIRLADKSGPPRIDIVGKMKSTICTMSTSALTAGPRGNVLGAWETDQQIFWSSLGEQGAPVSTAVPGPAGGRKHPALAINAAGQVLVVWTQGTGWERGGTIAWQIYDPAGQAIAAGAGRARGLPAWGAPAAFARPDGSFVVVF